MMTGVVVIVPVKALAAAKGRLAVRLSPEQRARVVLGALDRVVAAALGAALVDRCLVVSADRTVLARAAANGAEVLEETVVTMPSSHNLALEQARIAACQRWNPSAVLVLAGDLPLITSADIDALISLGSEPDSVVVAPDRNGSGTNALFLRPPTALAFRFGLDSFAAHSRDARTRGLRVQVYRERGTAFDVDQPEDLDALGESVDWFEGAIEQPSWS